MIVLKQRDILADTVKETISGWCPITKRWIMGESVVDWCHTELGYLPAFRMESFGRIDPATDEKMWINYEYAFFEQDHATLFKLKWL